MFCQRANILADRWPSDHRRNMLRSRLHVSFSGRKSSSRDMLFGQELSLPFHKGCAPLICAVLAMWGGRKRICSTWPPRQRSISFVLLTGLMTIRSRPPEFLLLSGFTRQPGEFASSVVIGGSSVLLYRDNICHELTVHNLSLPNWEYVASE